MELVKKRVPITIEEHKPDIIFYNAGTDISILDPIGSLFITEEGIIKRDEMVFKNVIVNDIPILMVLTGGYQEKSGFLIWQSVDNLLRQFYIK